MKQHNKKTIAAGFAIMLGVFGGSFAMAPAANATAHQVAWFDGDNCTGGTPIWYQGANTESSSIGSASNKAQSFRLL